MWIGNKQRRLGVRISDLFTTLQTNLGAYYVNDFNLFGRTYRVFLQADATVSHGDRRISVDCTCGTATSEMVPLEALW